MTDLSNTDTDNGEKEENLSSNSYPTLSNRDTSPADSYQGNFAEDSYKRYTLSDYYDLTLPLISGKSLQSLNIHSFLRTLVDFSLSHSLQLRALQKREIKFADLSLDQKEFSPILVIKSIFPKTTQVQYSACVRHKLVELCPQFILAMYLFARFHIQDTFGELDLTEDSVSDYQFLDYKLLNGGKKLRPLSYSQQYKASTKILKFMDDFKPVNLGKILTAQYNTDPNLGAVRTSAEISKPLANTVDGVQSETLSQLAGFESLQDYKIDRDSPEPPKAVVEQIFPFLNDYDFQSNSPANDFYTVMNHLRRLLVQDMVEIQKRFPDNLLCGHPIFKSPEFIEFAGIPPTSSVLKAPIPFSDKEQDSPPDEDSISSEDESLNLADEESDGPAKQTKRVDSFHNPQEQNKRMKNLEIAVEHIRQQQQNLTKEFRQFIDVHASQLASQSRSITNLINSTNGLSVLLTARSNNSTNYARQVLHENASGLESVRTQIAKQRSDLINAQDLWAAKFSNLQPRPLPSQGSHFPQLSVNVSTIAEVWEDYKKWEADLVQRGITKQEWLRSQLTSVTQLQNTRDVVVKFIEHLAFDRLLPISIVIEKLQRLMRQQLLPPSISELSKRISGGFQIEFE